MFWNQNNRNEEQIYEKEEKNTAHVKTKNKSYEMNPTTKLPVN